MRHQGRLFRLRPLTAVIAGSSVFLTVLTGFRVGFVCQDQWFWSRLYLTKVHIKVMAFAAEEFRTRRGVYPADLAELASAKLLLKIPDTPWGTPYLYEVEHGAGGEKITIRAIPDWATQEIVGVSELTNRTDWRGILKP